MGVRGAVVVRVAFLPNRALQRLKLRHLGRRAAFVNVLTFPEPEGFPHPESRRRSLGEIYLNDSYPSSDPDEGVRMFIHGMAHLCGFNHKGRRDTIDMQAAEHRVLARIAKVRGTYRLSSHHQGKRYENSHRT
jgi:ssRNA-specific RNase YbeY (16S rRNA maturation enzyme)